MPNRQRSTEIPFCLFIISNEEKEKKPFQRLELDLEQFLEAQSNRAFRN